VSRVVVFGGYGTFGSLVAKDLVRRGADVVIAGRDAARARRFAAELGPSVRGVAADATDAASCRAALDGATVAASCAGPFSALGEALLDACVAAGCHYVDITDDRAFARRVRDWGPRFEAAGLAAVYGASSLPGISGALAIAARAAAGEAPVEHARVTLFIGNDNPKGSAAVHSFVPQLGRAIEAPQGTIKGFRDAERVELPAPFGPRTVYNMESPEYDLFPSLLGAPSVSVKLGFELRAAAFAFGLLARLGSRWGARTARTMTRIGRIASGSGHSGGAVMTELFLGGGRVVRAVLHGAEAAQTMAALPCSRSADRLRAAPPPRPGAQTAYDLLGARALLDAIVAEGYTLTID
jgi:hypothetical protein